MKRTAWMRIVFLIVALLVTGFIVFTALKPSPIRVESSQAKVGPLSVTVDAEGKTRVRDRFVVAAPVAGRLARINLHRGDQIAQNAIVARIEPLPIAPLDPRQLAEATARVAGAEQLRNEAEAGMAHVRADYEQAQRELARAEKLVETGDISRQEFERIRNAAQTARQQLEAARFRARAAASDVEVARAALLAVERAGQSSGSATVVVRAPVSGRVLRIAEENERVVMAGAPLIELSNPTLEIVIDVLSSDAVKIRPGVPVVIEGWGEDKPLQAHVRMIEPSGFTKVSALGIEEQRVNVVADFVDPQVPLGDGYRVEARIVIWEKADALKVPTSAVFRSGEGWAAFVNENGRARRRDVQVGRRTAFEAEIINGLREGEQVVVHPPNELKDGARVVLNQR